MTNERSIFIICNTYSPSCLFIWGKVRYDALAIGALFVLVVLEIIPANDAFAGFAHPAVVTVALVLIISQGLKNSGLTGLLEN